MKSLAEVMQALEKAGTDQTRKTFARHGITGDVYGVKVGDLKTIAKQIKGRQELGCELYDSGNYDAMYLAGIVCNGAQMTKAQLEQWGKTSRWGTIAEYTVPGVATESKHAEALAAKWIKSRQELIATSGWNTYAGIVAVNPDAELDLEHISSLLEHVVDSIDEAPNRVRYTMNGYVISVGTYVAPLLQQAKEAAKKIGNVSVDMGDTACKVPLASEYIHKVESMGRVGKKRKTMKC